MDGTILRDVLAVIGRRSIGHVANRSTPQSLN
jgi:hypothetical protein